jgi:hypothetical protein
MSRLWTGSGVFWSDRLHTRAIVPGGSPMTDVAYLCHNCGSVHEVESIRENLILDLRAAASYELSGQRGMLDTRARVRRWRITLGLAQALWPGYPHHPRLARGRRRVQGQPAPVARSRAGQQLAAATRAQVSGFSRYPWPTGQYRRRHLRPAPPPRP